MNALRVAKVGGSLLDYGDLVPALRKWLSRQSPLPTVLICGGGLYADWVREADVRFGYGEEKSHWLSIEVLSVTARILASRLPEVVLEQQGVASLLRQLGDLSRPDASPLFVFDPRPFLRTEEPHMADPLPHTWSVTSDSIAARVAEALDATELVLLKSAPASGFPTCAIASEAGFVDAYFPRAVKNLARVRAVNLRSEELEEVLWSGSGNLECDF